MSNTVSVAQKRRKRIVLDPSHFAADRVRVYPKSVHGPARTVKWAVLVMCLAIYYILPWLRWDRGAGRPSQMVLLDLPNRRFYFDPIELWPQDLYLLAGALICGAVALFLITSVAGRLWCGYSCPQTVWTDLFMWVERRIEGDRNERIKRDEGPTNFAKVWRKIAKHAVWLIVAFWTGGAWIMYYVNAPTAVTEFWTGQASAAVYFFTALFTLTTYVLGGWARELVCTYMCPWPRFQASMLDEQSLIVTYQRWRGEPRGHGKRDAAHGKLGDCVDCNACVHACPTGIDIRDGVQLECINCGLCVDACNEIMVKLDQPKWLVTWDTLARQSAKAAGKTEGLQLIRPRTMVYVGALAVVVTVMVTAFVLRPTQGLFVMHDRAPLFVMQPDGVARNGYSIAITNKTSYDQHFTLRLEGVPGATMRLAENGGTATEVLEFPVPGDSISTYRVLVAGAPAHLTDGTTPLEFRMVNAATGVTSSYASAFVGGATHQ